LGHQAGYDVTEGFSNTLLGYNTGRGITTGDKNTIVGANVTGLDANLSNNIILADGDGNQRIRVNSSGNVGIGTTAPASLLEVAANTGGVLSISTNGQAGSLVAPLEPKIQFLGYADTVKGAILVQDKQGNQTGGWMKFQTADSANTLQDRMIIDRSGLVGIGTTSPSTKLHIGAGAMTLEAMTAPSSPASDKAVLFLEATGTSPSRTVALKVKWEDGSTSTLASVTV